MENKPLISVLVTSFNREKYIEECLVSILQSSYTYFEVIILDDCSTDNTVKIAEEIAKKDDRISIIVNEKNIGQFQNRNKAVSFARGEYIMFVDSDDTIFPDTIAKIVSLMSAAPNVHFGMVRHKCSEASVMDSKEAIHHHFFKQSLLLIGPGGTIIRRSFFNEINGYTEKYAAAGDMYFNLKACCYSPVMFMPFEFVFYRRHETQEINNSYSYLYNNYLYERDALAELPLPLLPEEKKWVLKKMNRRFLLNLLKYFFSTGNIGKTMHAVKLTRFSFRSALQAVFQR